MGPSVLAAPTCLLHVADKCWDSFPRQLIISLSKRSTSFPCPSIIALREWWLRRSSLAHCGAVIHAGPRPPLCISPSPFPAIGWSVTLERSTGVSGSCRSDLQRLLGWGKRDQEVGKRWGLPLFRAHGNACTRPVSRRASPGPGHLSLIFSWRYQEACECLKGRKACRAQEMLNTAYVPSYGLGSGSMQSPLGFTIMSRTKCRLYSRKSR